MKRQQLELQTHFGMQPLCLFKHKLNQGTIKPWNREGISVVGRTIEAKLCSLKKSIDYGVLLAN